MSDEYILRSDVDKLLKDLYWYGDKSYNFVGFDEGSNLQPLQTIDQILKKYISKNEFYEQLLNGNFDVYVDTSNLVSVDELNRILSSYVVSSALSDYALRSELFSGDYNDLTGKPVIPSKTSQLTNDSGFLTSHQSLEDYLTESEINTLLGSYVLSNKLSEYYNAKQVDNRLQSISENIVTTKLDVANKVDKSNGANQMTDSNAYNHIGTSANATQKTINTAINTVLGDVFDELDLIEGFEFIKIVSSKPTASSSTMNNLYVVSENNKVNVYYTKKDGSSYTWVKLDDNILDELDISWSSVTGKPSTFPPSNHTHDAEEIMNIVYTSDEGWAENGTLQDYVQYVNQKINQTEVPSKLSEILTHIDTNYNFYS